MSKYIVELNTPSACYLYWKKVDSALAESVSDWSEVFNGDENPELKEVMSALEENYECDSEDVFISEESEVQLDVFEADENMIDEAFSRPGDYSCSEDAEAVISAPLKDSGCEIKDVQDDSDKHDLSDYEEGHVFVVEEGGDGEAAYYLFDIEGEFEISKLTVLVQKRFGQRVIVAVKYDGNDPEDEAGPCGVDGTSGKWRHVFKDGEKIYEEESEE